MTADLPSADLPSADLPRGGRLDAGGHLYPVHVYYEDTDAEGIVYHASYLRFAERARSEMLRALGVEHGRLRREWGTALVVRRMGIEYYAPARLDDELVVATQFVGAAGATLRLAQEVRRDAALLVQLEVLVASVGASGRPLRLPAAFKAALAILKPKMSRNPSQHWIATAHAR